MTMPTMNQPKYELCFRPLIEAGRGYAFPCNAQGSVDLDVLSDSARNDYLYARALIGHAYRPPIVETLQ